MLSRLLLVTFALAATIAQAAPRMLTSPAEVATRLQDPNTVIIHVGTLKDYAEGHIPGARLLTLADISTEGATGLRVEILPADQLRAALLKAGVHDGARVVLYGPNIVQTTRAWFTFDYLGIARMASILDGGLAAWKSAGRPVSVDPAGGAAASGTLTIRPNPALIVDAAWISPRLKAADTAIVDARLPEFYTGAQAGANMPRAGHIPGAANIPYSTLVDANQRFLSPAELRARFGSRKPPIVYCHIGMQATVAYFAARSIGRHPRLYDGSWQDWSRRQELPVEK